MYTLETLHLSLLAQARARASTDELRKYGRKHEIQLNKEKITVTRRSSHLLIGLLLSAHLSSLIYPARIRQVNTTAIKHRTPRKRWTLRDKGGEKVPRTAAAAAAYSRIRTMDFDTFHYVATIRGVQVLIPAKWLKADISLTCLSERKKKREKIACLLCYISMRALR